MVDRDDIILIEFLLKFIYIFLKTIYVIITAEIDNVIKNGKLYKNKYYFLYNKYGF